LPYWSHIDDFHCTLNGHSKLQRSSEGAVPDVAGLIPVKSAESGPDPKIICNYGNVIVYTKTNTLWVQQFVPIHVRVTSNGTNGDQKTSSVSEPEGLYDTNGYVVKGSGSASATG
jgi:hypothetical protein